MKISRKGRQLCGVGIIATVYVYFLIFAQFGFLRLAQIQEIAGQHLRFIMGCMGMAGVVGSLCTACAFSEARARRLLLLGLAGCALAATLALGAEGTATFGLAAALIGGFLGLLTVSLIGNLPRFFPGPHRGTLIGLGTGLAYALCNIPAIFAGTPILQTLVAIAGCAFGAMLTLLAGISEKHSAPSPAVPGPFTGSGPAFVLLVVVFLMLIWLDSAVFYILQNTPGLNRFGWAGSALQWKNAGIHFTVAILAGIWLDRGGMMRLLLLAFACLGGAALCVSSHTPVAQLTQWFYASAVSLYSTALVYTPLVGSNSTDVKRCAVRAGILYAMAGWVGSALGIGMAQDLHSIPLWFLGLAATVVACCCWGWKTENKLRNFARRSTGIIGAAMMLFFVARTSSAKSHLQPPAGFDAPSSELGREIYISEGCMNCHSQYVRPGTSDEILWGPVAKAEQIRKQQPPLIGNRRQGPDLMNAGNRRTPIWNRIHLINPRALAPGSRMPSYAYLFEKGDMRGESLLAYLADLGCDTAEERHQIGQHWQPKPGTAPIPREAQAMLFHEVCSQCHGENGTGDGWLADQLGPRKPRDLSRARWEFIPERDTPAERRLDLQRVIKFGLPGLSMPGHEYFDDEKVLGLAEYVESLRAPEGTR